MNSSQRQVQGLSLKVAETSQAGQFPPVVDHSVSPVRWPIPVEVELVDIRIEHNMASRRRRRRRRGACTASQKT